MAAGPVSADFVIGDYAAGGNGNLLVSIKSMQ